MRISGGAVPAREMEERMFEWIEATYQTGRSAEVEPFGDHSGALDGLTRRGGDRRQGATVCRGVKTGTT